MSDDEAVRRSATLAGARLPENVKQEIINLVQEEGKKIAVLQLPIKYQQKYGKELSTEVFGFKTLNDMLGSIVQIELEHDPMIMLWYMKIKEGGTAEEEGMEVDEHDEEATEEQQKNEQSANKEQGTGDNGGKEDDVIVLEDTVELRAPPVPIPLPVVAGTSRERPKLPPIPSPAQSVSSTASSTASGAPRARRLPPPPPSMDWSSGSRSIFGKRQGSVLTSDAKRLQLDEDVDSVSSALDEAPPTQNRRQLEKDRREIRYIPPDRNSELLTFDSLILGKKMGVVQPATYVDTTFCERDVLERLMEVKYDIRKVGAPQFQELQRRMNDFVSPPTAFIFNSAYLYANIDALTNWCLTNPCLRNGESIVGPEEPLYAVDIHGGPGGFVEYLLTKKSWQAKVYGFTYKEDLFNYKLVPTGHFPKESFEQWFGLEGGRGDGSIYKPSHVECFGRYVRRNTDMQGVHLVVADGQELSPGLDEDRKELRVKPLILAESFIALKVLREGGTFVLRLYDVFTPYTAGLIYLLYRCFDSVAIIRPEATLQGSAERFLVCKHFRGGKLSTEVRNYLQTLHNMEFGCHYTHKRPDEQQAEIVELVPVDLIKDSESFYEYLRRSNLDIGKEQLDETSLMCRAIQGRHDGRIIAQRKNNIRLKCAEVWNCARRLRQEPRYTELSPELYLARLLRPYPENVLNRTEREGEVLLSYATMQKTLTCAKEWHFVSVGRDRGFYMGRGGDRVYRFSGGKWKLVNEEMELADMTLVYGDIVDEITQLEGKQITQTAFHIIDGMVLGGKDIRNLSYEERISNCVKFAQSMCKPSLTKLILVRAKRVQEAKSLETALMAVHNEQVKGRGDRKKKPLAPVDIDVKGLVYAHTGYLFMRTTKTAGVSADFITTMQNRLYWQLNDSMDRNPSAPAPPRPDPKLLGITPVDAPTLAAHIKRI